MCSADDLVALLEHLQKTSTIHDAANDNLTEQLVASLHEFARKRAQEMMERYESLPALYIHSADACSRLNRTVKTSATCQSAPGVQRMGKLLDAFYTQCVLFKIISPHGKLEELAAARPPIRPLT